ncbi:MAG: serine/threonine-protein kinase, partial [Dokdonella sp.]
LGEGGMGRVFLAQEIHPARQVALKLVSGLSTQARQRFQREIEALAQLEHPAIARLYGAGQSSWAGVDQAWFSMEFVDGSDLLDHARTQAISLSSRLELLIAIARGVHFANQSGVIHRDLKPSNILVSADGQPKILDFGIARLRDDNAATLTQAGQVLGTVPYIAPEQLTGGHDLIDARADVYSLGVIAYQLLGGELPHPRLGTSTLFEAMQILRDEQPLPLASLQRAARGDLDTVVMKALASEPPQRYASAAAFADDLQRVIDHQPISARPPSWRYRSARFVRRHRALTIATAGVLMALVAATAISLRFAWSAQQSRAQAEQRAAESNAINTFLERMLVSADPEKTRGEKLTVAMVVDQAERELSAITNQPAVQRAVLSTLASTRRALGDYDDALQLNGKALALFAGDGGSYPEGSAQQSRLLQARASLLTDKGDFELATATLADARKSDPTPSPAAELGMAITAARIDDEAGRVDEGIRGYRDVLAAAETLAPLDPASAREVAETLDYARSNLASMLREAGKFDEAEAMIRQVLATRTAQHGEREPRTLSARQKLAMILSARGQDAQAAAEATAVLAIQREVLGKDHGSTLTTMQTLANALIAEGNLDEAEPITREALTGLELLLGEDHAQTLSSMNSLAYLLEQRKQTDAAETMYRRIIMIQERAGVGHPTTLAPRNNLAMLLMDAGELPAARREFESLVTDSRRAVGEDHAMTLIFSSNYGLCLDKSGQSEQAREILEPAHSKLVALMGRDHARTRAAAERLADIYQHMGLDDLEAKMRPTVAP